MNGLPIGLIAYRETLEVRVGSGLGRGEWTVGRGRGSGQWGGKGEWTVGRGRGSGQQGWGTAGLLTWSAGV